MGISLVIVVSTEGSTPRGVDAKMIVFEDGRVLKHRWRR
ncbi:XdhC family protein [Clostridium mucosae]